MGRTYEFDIIAIDGDTVGGGGGENHAEVEGHKQVYQEAEYIQGNIPAVFLYEGDRIDGLVEGQ